MEVRKNRRARSSSESYLVLFSNVEEFCQSTGGSRPIKKVLIANNGISAVKAIRSIRQWSYEIFGNEKEVEFVVMATPEDLKANAEYIRMADEFVEVPGGSNNNNYANVDLIVETAETSKVDAVWAGWGHASEQPSLPDSLARTKSKIVFIGPPSGPMKALGDKIGSTIIAQSANVPVIPWNGEGITIDDVSGNIPDALYAKANVTTVEAAISECDRIGFPLMIKASEGGGGKGIRKVLKREDVQASFRQVQGEVPGSPIFIMRLAENSRHLEVQLLADQHGNAISLSGRDCSVQRRHQKIIEEGPVLATSDETWEDMMSAAVRLAKQVGYQNAGTVEYLYLPAEEKFAFLELNPRLQVEHPVTEMITRVNLPAAQLCVAMGIPLGNIPDIRRLYGRKMFGDITPIDFDKDRQNPPEGHVIAARITAENPDLGFQPTSGAVSELNFRSTKDVWGYFSVDSSGLVHEFADSQIGHLFSFGSSRERARKSLIMALKELSIRGDIHTTIEYLVGLMEDEDYQMNNISTAWLDKRIQADKAAAGDDDVKGKPESLLIAIIGSVHRAFQMSVERKKEYMTLLGQGKVPQPELLSSHFDTEIIFKNIKYCFHVQQSGEHDFFVGHQGSMVQAVIRPLSDNGFLVLFAGKSHVIYAFEEPSGLRLTINGHTAKFETEYDPTSLTAESSGKLVRYLVPDNIKIESGTAYAEMEVMKMFLPLIAPESGVIHQVKPAGSILNTGDLVAKMTLAEPGKVKKSTVFTSSLPQVGPPQSDSVKLNIVMSNANSVLESALMGYAVPSHYSSEVVDTIHNLSKSESAILAARVESILSACASRLPPQCSTDLQTYLNNTPTKDFKLTDIEEIVMKNIPSSKEEQPAYNAVVEPLLYLIGKYSEMGLFTTLRIECFQKFIDVESKFCDCRRPDAIERLRNEHKNELEQVFYLDRAHHMLKQRCELVSIVLYDLKRRLTSERAYDRELAMLSSLAELPSDELRGVRLIARKLLLSNPEKEHEQEELFAGLEASLNGDKNEMQRLVEDAELYNENLANVMFTHKEKYGSTVMEIYARRLYRAFKITDMKSDGSNAQFKFTSKSQNKQTDSFGSSDDLAALLSAPSTGNESTRFGVLGSVNGLDALEQECGSLFALLPNYEGKHPMNVVHILCLLSPEDNISLAADDSTLLTTLSKYLENNKDTLTRVGVKRVTFNLVPQFVQNAADEEFKPRLFTFRQSLNFAEDPVVRHIEPTLSGYLNLKRLSNFDIHAVPTPNRLVHVYDCAPTQKIMTALKRDSPLLHSKIVGRKRYFVRMMVRRINGESAEDYDVLQNTFQQAIGSLEVAMGTELLSEVKKPTGSNHLFFNVIPDFQIDPECPHKALLALVESFADKLRHLRVSEIEFRLQGRYHVNEPSVPIRIILQNPTGYVFHAFTYVETVQMQQPSANFGSYGVSPLDTTPKMETFFTSITPGGSPGPLDRMPIHTPYVIHMPFQHRRALARAMSDTVYVYDFPELFEASLRQTWEKHIKAYGLTEDHIPANLLRAAELILVDDSMVPSGRASNPNSIEAFGLTRTHRPQGENDIGMVAWSMDMKTPEYPEGRTVIVIANDLTFLAGTFGTREDALFDAASKYSRANGLPRLYIAANSGARIQLANEVKAKFQVCWNDIKAPTKGFKYLYLNEEDNVALATGSSPSVKTVRVVEDGEVRHRITDIIGHGKDLGVENLRGSGTIAGETSRAYDDVFTLTLVTGRTVGIGAYLVRLGQRTIQKGNAGPILLTGFQALNNLMGSNVYADNLQLGGPRIMFPNGVSHTLAEDDMDVVAQTLEWLSYIPKYKGATLPVMGMPTGEQIEREVEASPSPNPYNPRDVLAGHMDGDRFLSGFFDKGSWQETLGGWAQTVIVGRGRLGGIPVGLVTAECRTVTRLIPADPASPDSSESVIQQAGQVWFPDSAFKTAQAIKDMDREGLPLFVFANWRGFSGGQRDMFDEVLKFGSMIVDALVSYTKPVMVYIPAYGELRGGAWVVVDPTINSEVMEMYADPTARGNVLEPAGATSIKFRQKDMVTAASRIDSELKRLNKEKTELAAEGKPLDEVNAAIKARIEKVLPLYKQIANQFADLHDTPGRMHAKECIREVIPWNKSRVYFYWRLKRRLAEFDVIATLMKNDSALTRESAVDLIRKMFDEQARSLNCDVDALWNEDQRVLDWFAANREAIFANGKHLRQKHIASEVISLGMEDAGSVVNGLMSMLSLLPPAQRENVLEKLRKGVTFNTSGGAQSPLSSGVSATSGERKRLTALEIMQQTAHGKVW